MERKIPIEELTEINEGEFMLILSTMAQELIDELQRINSIPHQIQMQENAQYRIKYYMDPDGNPILLPIKKKELGFLQ